MSHSRKKFHKRGPGIPGGTGLSKSFRNARNLLQSGNQAAGLAILNRLSAEDRNPARRARVALLIASSESSLSRHTEAAAAFSKAGQLARQSGDATLALQAGVGEVRSLLRSLQTDAAKAAARQLLEDLSHSQQRFDRLAGLSPEQLARHGAVTLPPRPPRVTVALTGIAHAFAQSGLTAEAREFLEKAVVLSPNGASRARQLLAKLALAADDPELAERHAREALQSGRFQAKTIGAWQLYLDARARQNKVPILEPVLFDGLLTHAKGRLLSAPLLSIVRVLRAHGDETWKSIARSALAAPKKADPVILTEIEKILHADAKLTLSEPPDILAARSLKLFRANDVSAYEQIAHAKSHIRLSFEAGKTPDLRGLVKLARARHGEAHAIAIRHTAALGAMLARRHDVAREWLNALIGDLQPGTEPWGKALWALARMESLFEERQAEAALHYLELAENTDTPPRFRIQAMLRGFKFLGASGNPVNSPEISATIRNILSGIDDYRILLDASRQLALAGSQFAHLRREAADRGTALADEVFANAATPRESLGVIEYLSRKLLWDLGRTHAVVQRWESLSERQRTEFQAIGGSIWYEYLYVVYQSLADEKRHREAEHIAAGVLNHDGATPEGFVIVGSIHSAWLMRDGRKDEALGFFEWISQEHPTHRKAAVAHYWLALRDMKQGFPDRAKSRAEAIRKCFSGKPALLKEWQLDAAAVLILNGSEISAVGDSPSTAYSEEFMTKASNMITEDIGRL